LIEKFDTSFDNHLEILELPVEQIWQDFRTNQAETVDNFKVFKQEGFIPLAINTSVLVEFS
jgi:hypothetical protein